MRSSANGLKGSKHKYSYWILATLIHTEDNSSSHIMHIDYSLDMHFSQMLRGIAAVFDQAPGLDPTYRVH
jgi:hypothetical protein